MQTLDDYCKDIKGGSDTALVALFHAPEIRGIVSGQMRYFLSLNSSYTSRELEALIQNTIWHLIMHRFLLPTKEHTSGKTILSFLSTRLGQYVHDTINKVERFRPLPRGYDLEVDILVPSPMQIHEEAEEIQIQKDYVEWLLNTAKETKLLKDADIAVLLLRNHEEMSYQKIADECTKRFRPKKPYTSGWAEGRYKRGITVLRNLALRTVEDDDG